MSLKALVVCKFDGCGQIYDDPRILPCGNRSCAAHIDEMLMKQDERGTNTDRKIKCHFCHKIHNCSGASEVGGGFPLDENIPLLLSMKHSEQHEAATKSFAELAHFLDKLTTLETDQFVIDYFERVEAEIAQERENNMQKLIAHYQKLTDEVREHKLQCLHKLTTSNRKCANVVETIQHALAQHKSKLERDNVSVALKTVDGDEAKWRSIRAECNAMLDKVKSLENELKQMLVGGKMWIGFRPSSSPSRNRIVERMCGRLDKRLLDSLTISSFAMENELVELCKLGSRRFKLAYRASRDGFDAATFHARCDHKPKTLTIIRTTGGHIFGAYNAVTWDSTTADYKVDPKAFIFSLVNEHATPKRIPVKAGNKYSTNCNASYGPIYGGGHDLIIWSNSNTSMESYSNLGSSYDFTLFKTGTVKAQSFLAGARNFQTSEIEVFTCRKLKQKMDEVLIE